MNFLGQIFKKHSITDRQTNRHKHTDTQTHMTERIATPQSQVALFIPEA